MATIFHKWTISGIGDEAAKKILDVMYCTGLMDESFEAYKEWTDKEYYRLKWRKLYGNSEEAEAE